MEQKFEEQFLQIDATEHELRLERMAAQIQNAGADAFLICDNANLFYLTGRVFCGFALVRDNATARYFVRRPTQLHGDEMTRIHKLEDIPGLLSKLPQRLGLDLSLMYYNEVGRVKAAFSDAEIIDCSQALRAVRAVKTPEQVRQMQMSGEKQTLVYKRIPKLYREGMSDIELQIEIERALRLEGCLGKFPVSGHNMEIFMANVLTGENADTPSPYDFAMGGAGLHPSLPVGADGTIIRPGQPVMVDANGNFTAYMTDMTRCFILGETPHDAARLNLLSAEICDKVSAMARPGAKCSELYEAAVSMARDAGAEDYFMGHRYHAGFVGHGVGIEINEGPVLAPRSRDIIQEGNTIAIEPKFVVPGIGAVGIENTYVVAHNETRKLTTAPEEIISFDY